VEVLLLWFDCFVGKKVELAIWCWTDGTSEYYEGLVESIFEVWSSSAFSFEKVQLRMSNGRLAVFDTAHIAWIIEIEKYLCE